MKKENKNIFIIITFGIISILLFCFICIGHFRTESPVLDQNAKSWEAKETSDNSDQIKIPGYDEIIFKANETTQQITLYNPEGNPCYFTFSLYIDQDETAVYQSDMVEPGKAIESVVLSHALSEGDYQLNIHIDTYDLDTQTPLNAAISSARLSVQ